MTYKIDIKPGKRGEWPVTCTITHAGDTNTFGATNVKMLTGMIAIYIKERERQEGNV
jgi:hypothetical protein